jgi:hypothetical protein
MAARKLKAVPSLPSRTKILVDYPYTKCREQHVWMPYDGRCDWSNKIAYRIQICGFCPTLRKSELSLKEADKGKLIKSSTYKYPGDYRIVGGLAATERDRMRFANFLAELDTIENKKGKK